MSEDKKSDMGKKAVTTTLAVFTAAGLAVSNAVDSPTELLEDSIRRRGPQSHVQTRG